MEKTHRWYHRIAPGWGTDQKNFPYLSSPFVFPVPIKQSMPNQTDEAENKGQIHYDY